jgi:hypothetical protein
LGIDTSFRTRSGAKSVLWIRKATTAFDPAQFLPHFDGAYLALTQSISQNEKTALEMRGTLYDVQQQA